MKRRISAIAETDPAFHARLTAFYAAGFDAQLALARETVRLVYDA